MVVGKTNIDSDQMDAAKPTRTDTQNQNQQRPNVNPNPNPNSKSKKKKGGPISMDHVLLALQETKDERDLRIRALLDFFDAANLGYLDCPQIETYCSLLLINLFFILSSLFPLPTESLSILT